MSLKKVKVLVIQSCLTLCDSMDCSPPGSSVQGDSPSKNTGVGCHTLPPGDLSNPGIEPRSPTLQADALLLSHQRSHVLATQHFIIKGLQS